MTTALITGVSGQDGSYLAELLLGRGYNVVGIVRPDGSGNLERIRHIAKDLELIEVNLADQQAARSVVDRYRPREVYNFAARASSSQLISEPVATGDVNGLGVARLLEAIRSVDPAIRFCQASSSEMFGRSVEWPQNEETPFRPRNPYGVAKLFAHGMVGAYREHFDMFACSSILYNHESPRRPPNMVTRKISRGVALVKAGLAQQVELGNLDARRDWGFAGDYVRGMWLMLQADEPADYVLATGVDRSVREFCEIAFAHVGLDYRNHVTSRADLVRGPETVRLVGDATRARSTLGWQTTVSFEELVAMMVDADVRMLASG